MLPCDRSAIRIPQLSALNPPCVKLLTCRQRILIHLQTEKFNSRSYFKKQRENTKKNPTLYSAISFRNRKRKFWSHQFMRWQNWLSRKISWTNSSDQLFNWSSIGNSSQKHIMKTCFPYPIFFLWNRHQH